MFHVKSYMAFEVSDWWERTKACLQLLHKLSDGSFLGD